MVFYTPDIEKEEFKLIRTSISKHWGSYFLLGVSLMIGGLLCLYLSVITTRVSVIIFGSTLALGGIASLFHAIRFWRLTWGNFLMHVLIGCFYITAGIYILYDPTVGQISLTLLLGLFYTLIGALRITLSFTPQLPSWAWMLLSGTISLLLGVAIMFYWPAVHPWIIGLWIASDILFLGVWMLILSLQFRIIAH